MHTWQIVAIASSTAAVVISLISFYFRWIRVRGPRVFLVNDGDDQTSRVRTYAGLPLSVQQDFPYFKGDVNPGHAIVSVVLANTGDRPVSVNMENVTIDGVEQSRIEISKYSYALVPPTSVIKHNLILRNIPPLDTDRHVTIRLKLPTKGPSGLRQKLKDGLVIGTIGVVLRPSELDETHVQRQKP